MSRLSRARWPWLVLVALLAGGLAVAALDGSSARTSEERARGLAETIKCPTCQGQSVADSSSPAAKNIRTEIVRRMEAGQTDQEIRDGIVATYGEDLLLTPPRSGVGALVWFLPVALFVGAVGGLVATFRRWRTPSVVEVSDADRVLVEQARRR
jgi:cytochrome c-type biogenesis protein CcmH